MITFVPPYTIVTIYMICSKSIANFCGLRLFDFQFFVSLCWYSYPSLMPTSSAILNVVCVCTHAFVEDKLIYKESQAKVLNGRSRLLYATLISPIFNLMVLTEASWWNISRMDTYGWWCDSETRVPSSRGLVKQYNQELCISSSPIFVYATPAWPYRPMSITRLQLFQNSANSVLFSV